MFIIKLYHKTITFYYKFIIDYIILFNIIL